MKYVLAATILVLSSGLVFAETPPDKKGTPAEPPAATAPPSTTPGAPPTATPSVPTKKEQDIESGKSKDPNKGQASGHDLGTGK